MDEPETWTRGFEIELVAPVGSSRETLAKRIAELRGGSTKRVFYPQSERASRPSVLAYETLTLAFQVLDAAGRPFALLADDITLNADLRDDVEGAPGFYRILSTSKPVLDLVELHASADASLDDVLVPLAALFGTRVAAGEAGVRVVRSRSGVAAMAFPLAGDRERACEVITPPLPGDEAILRRYLGMVLGASHDLGFFVPEESATHVHFDGKLLQDAKAIRNLVCVFGRFGRVLREVLETNPSCTRLGGWPAAFVELATSEAFLALPWPAAARAVLDAGVVKWCDYNVLNLVDPFATKRTFEVRVLGTTFDVDLLVERSMLLARLLGRAVSSPPLARKEEGSRADLDAFLAGGAF
jgi:hypothetical protein